MANEVNKNVLAWMQSNIDQETKNEILKILKENEKELLDSFCKTLEFGTGGLRGKMGVGTNRMNKYTVGVATQGLANYLKKYFKNSKEIKVVIAYDTRNNSTYFAKITSQVLAANNIKVYVFDSYRPTPELSYAIRKLKANAGIVITASHNPKEYNGYKVYWDDGAQVIDPHDNNIIAEVNSLSIDDVKYEGNENLIQTIGEDIDSIYISELISTIPNVELFKESTNLKVVYTPLHGTGYPLLPKLLSTIGFKNIFVLESQAIPDGNFTTVKSPNPENKEAFKLAIEYAKTIDADIILATDPDADRIGVALKDTNGDYYLLNGNQTATILTDYILSEYKQKEKLKPEDYIVKTIVTSDMLTEIAEYNGIKTYEVLTGFKYIAKTIREKAGDKFLGGFEESYGYLFSDIVRDKDALMAALYVIEASLYAKNNNKTLLDILNEAYLKYHFYYTKLINIEKEGVEGIEEIKQIIETFREDVPAIINEVNVVIIRDYIEGIETNLFNGEQKTLQFPKSSVIQLILEDETKITIRPSGTEPKMKIYFSFKTKITSIDQISEKEKEFDRKAEAFLNYL